MIFDTHCHGYWRGLAGRDPELRRNMAAAGVERVVHVGTDLDTSFQAARMAEEWGSRAWSTAGLHPTSSQNMPPDSADDYVRRLERFIRENRDKVIAVGETGLDYFHMATGKPEHQKRAQHAFFEAQAALALRMDLPLVIHTRDAAADTISLLRKLKVRRAVIHCYSQTPEFAEAVLSVSSDIYFSFSAILTYPKAAPVRNTARTVRLDRILIETDAPFLVPHSLRDRFKINEPAFVRHVLDELKALRPESPDEVEGTVWENSNRFYGLPTA